MHSRAAMSLIEVTLVILVIGILAAVAAPRFAESYRSMHLQAAAKQLAAHIDYIRNVAINEGRTTLLVCDNNLHAYGSDSVDFPERIGESIQVSIPGTYDPTFTLAADFDSQNTVGFDFEGVPHVGAVPLVDGSIVLSADHHQFVVTIAAGTGKTSVARLPTGGGGGGGGGGGSPPQYQQPSQPETPAP